MPKLKFTDKSEFVIAVGDEVEMVDGGGNYIVKKISGNEICLENTEIDSEIDIYIEDLPEMFLDFQ